MATTDQLLQARGQDVHGSDGDKIGSLEEIYLDRETDEPEWASVKTGMFGTKVNLVPLSGSDLRDGELQVPFSKDKVKDAPNIDADEELSEDEERQLYDYYGVDYQSYEGTESDEFDRDRDTDLDRDDQTVARDTSGEETDSAMTLSEEELRVDKQRREGSAGRARLRKHIVTEEQTITVPVEREVATLEREPITDANADDATSGPALSEEEAEVTLSEEEVVVSKQAVPKERIRLEKDVVTEEQTVTEEVGREEVEVEGDVETRSGEHRDA